MNALAVFVTRERVRCPKERRALQSEGDSTDNSGRILTVMMLRLGLEAIDWLWKEFSMVCLQHAQRSMGCD